MWGRVGSGNGSGALDKKILILPGIEFHLLGRPSHNLVIYTNYVVSAFTDTQNGDVMIIFVVILGLISTILLLLLLLLLLIQRTIKLRYVKNKMYLVFVFVFRDESLRSKLL
jgi:hypothetical protein